MKVLAVSSRTKQRQPPLYLSAFSSTRNPQVPKSRAHTKWKQHVFPALSLKLQLKLNSTVIFCRPALIEIFVYRRRDKKMSDWPSVGGYLEGSWSGYQSAQNLPQFTFNHQNFMPPSCDPPLFKREILSCFGLQKISSLRRGNGIHGVLSTV